MCSAMLGEAQGGIIVVDFLHGAVIEGRPSPKLAKAVQLYRDSLSSLCKKQGVSISDFVELTVRYSASPAAFRFNVSVTDRNGRRSGAEYGGFDGQRGKMIDGEGRLRSRPIKRARQTSPRRSGNRRFSRLEGGRCACQILRGYRRRCVL